ncbi:competence protein ComFC [Scopulibacillus daqui]|uniref:Competence protein ComFC n=1 Tax=Scopulibacillus daqui TaxID=1469162 RepID=A0ABS2PYA8_9BACL|nr:ComF family protein [Scopulibacillus daqui]MBM7645043.1 competence protein ComFC [Scopulibacillus daqui]
MGYCLWCHQAFQPKIGFRSFFSIDIHTGFCSICYKQLQPIDERECCRICGRHLKLIDAKYIKDDVCRDCRLWENSEWRGLLCKNRSLYVYNDFLKEVVKAFKFQGDVALVHGFKTDVCRFYKKHFRNAVVVPVPLSFERLAERGFNQSEHIAALIEKPVCHGLIRAIHENKQSKKGRKERMAHRENPFKANQKFKERLEGQSVLLIDDIYTTGATIRMAAEALRIFKPKEVNALTLARGA